MPLTIGGGIINITGAFVVGLSGNDAGGLTTPFTLGAGSGVIAGQAGNDVLIGDPGGSTRRSGSMANIVLVLDTSHSMNDQIPFVSTDSAGNDIMTGGTGADTLCV